MRIRFIYPRFKKFLQDHPALREELRDHVVGDYTMPPSLAIPILAALTPPDVEFALTDDNIGDPIDFDEKLDAAVISCFTPQAERAYEIADEYRRRGTTVLMGGIHPTCATEEALLHADAVCAGEGEPVWLQMLSDLRAKTLERVYRPAEVYDLANLPIPRRDLFKRDVYKWNSHLVLTIRGCPVRCEGCPIPRKEDVALRFRPIDNVIADIRSMPYREFYVTDDTIMLPGLKSKRYLLKMLKRTRELDVSIFLASTMMMIPEPEFYRELAKGKVSSIYTIFGFDRVSKRLLDPSCTPDEWKYGVDLVRMIEDAGIHFFASFGVGFDYQTPEVVDRILRFSEEAKIDLAEFYILSPFPGTPFGEQAEREGRILHRRYSEWNNANVVFEPKNFTQEQLTQAFETLWREFYRHKEPTKTLRSFHVTEDPVGPSSRPSPVDGRRS